MWMVKDTLSIKILSLSLLRANERPQKKLHEKGTELGRTSRLLDQLGAEGRVGENLTSWHKTNYCHVRSTVPSSSGFPQRPAPRQACWLSLWQLHEQSASYILWPLYLFLKKKRRKTFFFLIFKHIHVLRLSLPICVCKKSLSQIYRFLRAADSLVVRTTMKYGRRKSDYWNVVSEIR